MLFDVPAIVPLALSAWQALFSTEADRPQTAFPGHQLLKLNDGSSLPSPAFGVGSVHKFENVTDLVLSAFANGYRALDNSPFYSNEDTAGLAIASSGIAREALYVVSKWDAMHGQNVRKEVEASLLKLGTSYLDNLYIHFPQLATNLTDIWRQFEDVVDQGLTRTISVSNFNETVLAGLLEHARIKPAVNQVRRRPAAVISESAC
jgi:diketogulonate reductase-like aldo/keto reductase